MPFGCPEPLSAETCHGSWQHLFVSAVPSFSPRLSISFSCFTNVYGKLSKNAKTESPCICVSACLCMCPLNTTAKLPVWHMTTCEGPHVYSKQALNGAVYTNIRGSTHASTLTHIQKQARACTHTCTHTCKPINTRTHTLVFTEPLLMMGGSMMFVCVPKELALLLGPNQQPTAAGY